MKISKRAARNKARLLRDVAELNRAYERMNKSIAVFEEDIDRKQVGLMASLEMSSVAIGQYIRNINHGAILLGGAK